MRLSIAEQLERPLIRRIVIGVLLGQMCLAMLLSAANDTPTGDEPAHLAAALGYTRLHDLRFDVDNPPLSKLIVGWPLKLARLNMPPRDVPELPRLAEPHTTYGDVDIPFGNRILYGSGNDWFRLIWFARLPMIALTVLFAYCVYGFARDVFGPKPALFSLGVVSITPDVIAHGRLLNADVPLAGFLLITAWFLWRAGHRRPGWFGAAGLAYGCALATKQTALLMIPAFAIVALVASLTATRHQAWSARISAIVRHGAAFTFVAVGAVWLIYVAVDPKVRYERPNPRAEAATGRMVNLADRLPLPYQYRVGLKTKIRDDQSGRPAFLLGETYGGSKRHFYPSVLAIKTPPGLLLIFMGALGVLVATRRWAAAVFLTGPPLFLLGTAIATSHVNIGTRHVLLVPMFFAVAAGALVRTSRSSIVWLLVLAATFASVWRQHPSYLAYISEVFGGPNRGYRLVTESNLDWGQDLWRLRKYLDRNYPKEKVNLYYFGPIPPGAYGFDESNSILRSNYFRPIDPESYQTANPSTRETAPPSRVRGLVAVSAYCLHFHTFICPDLGNLDLPPPIDQIGHSILIYRIT